MKYKKKKIVIIGATSAIAEQCARIWLTSAEIELILVGRSLEKLTSIEADLKVRSPSSSITSIEADFIDPEKIQTVVNNICLENLVDIVLIAHGYLPSQDDCQNNLTECCNALSVNGISPVLFAEAFVIHMQKANTGTIAIISSVAGDRGRKSNYVYGAAKGLISRYAQGLQHRLAKSNVKVILVKPGPTDTPMTAHLKQGGAKLATADRVGMDIVCGINAEKNIVYTPKKWSLIMMIIRHIPNFLFKKLDI